MINEYSILNQCQSNFLSATKCNNVCGKIYFNDSAVCSKIKIAELIIVILVDL